MKFIKIEENQNLQPKVPRTFVETPMFQTQWKKNGLNDSDLQELQNKIMTEAPEADLGSGLYKFRFSPKRENRGQSGAYRILFVDVIVSEELYLLYCFPKNDKANLSTKELKLMVDISKSINNEVKNEKR